MTIPMSADPPYGYLPCGMPKCKNKAPLYLDPNNFNSAILCLAHRRKKRTHEYLPFCIHGHAFFRGFSSLPLPCDCTFEKDIDNATYDWLAKPKKKLEGKGQLPSPPSEQHPP